MNKSKTLSKIFKATFILFMFVLLLFLAYQTGFSDIGVYGLGELKMVRNLEFVKKLVKNKKVLDNAKKLSAEDVNTQSYNFVNLDKNSNTVVLNTVGTDEKVSLKTNNATFLVCFKSKESVKQNKINFLDNPEKLSDTLSTLYSFDEKFLDKIKGNYTQVKLSKDGYVIALLVGPCK